MKTIHLNQTDSTNLYLERHLSELPEICSVRADIQTAGRGRLSRQWDSAKGGLWFSVLFKTPTLSPFQLQKVCSLATLKSLKRELELTTKTIVPIEKSPSPEPFLLKWPNDIYYNSKKISGCLQKNILSSTASNCIIGVGVNINNPLPEELIKKAINLKTILSKEIDVEQLYHHISENIERRLSDFSQEELEENYKKHLLIKEGVHVKVLDIVNNNHYTGRVMGYPGETLEIFTEEGLQLSFKAADVTLKSWED
ncbi:MAG: biotin--[acetyl-CoA-carboxylase] ligase [Thermotogota bacterium]|nr:biotin--[acetyl-CoA-carboxylase] ligase [Thermotogota bacterium]